MQGFIIQFLLLCLVHTNGAAEQQREVLFSEIDCVVLDRKSVAAFNCSIVPPGQVNLDIVLSRDIFNLTALFNITFQRGTGKYMPYFSTSVDMCDLMGNAVTNFVLRMIAEKAREGGNFPYYCPLKKNVEYFVRNFKPDASLLPAYIPEIDFRTSAEIGSAGRPGITIKSYGNVVRRRVKQVRRLRPIKTFQKVRLNGV